MGEERFLRATDVVKKTTLSKATLYRKVKDGSFPAPTRLSHRVAVWTSSAVEKWMETAVAK